MFKDTKAFSGFSVERHSSDAKQFYGETLGLNVTEENGMLGAAPRRWRQVLVYPKENHEPATFTVLNFPVPTSRRPSIGSTEAGVHLRALRG